MNDFQSALHTAHEEACRKFPRTLQHGHESEHIQAIRSLFEVVCCNQSDLRRGQSGDPLVMRTDRATAMNMFMLWITAGHLPWPEDWNRSRQIFLNRLRRMPVNERGEPCDDEHFEHVLGNPQTYRYLVIGDQRNDSHYLGQTGSASGEASVDSDGVVTARTSLVFDMRMASGPVGVSIRIDSDQSAVEVDYGPEEAPTHLAIQGSAQFTSTVFGDGTQSTAIERSNGITTFRLNLSQRYRMNKKDIKKEEMAIAQAVAGLAHLHGIVCECEDEGLADVLVGEWLVQITRLKLDTLYKNSGTTGTGITEVDRSSLVKAFEDTVRHKAEKPYKENRRQILIVDTSYTGLSINQVRALRLFIAKSQTFESAYIGSRQWKDVIKLW